MCTLIVIVAIVGNVTEKIAKCYVSFCAILRKWFMF